MQLEQIRNQQKNKKFNNQIIIPLNINIDEVNKAIELTRNNVSA